MMENVHEHSAPWCTGLRFVGKDRVTVLLSYLYNGLRFLVLTCGHDDESKSLLPPGYDLEKSIEGLILLEIDQLSWGDDSKEKDERIHHLQKKLASLVGDSSLPLMQELAPPTTLPEPQAPPAPQNLDQILYPQAYTLQALTHGGKLICRKLESLGDYKISEAGPPLTEEQLRELDLGNDIPVVHATDVRVLQQLKSCVWKVQVAGEILVCKSSLDIALDALFRELNAYRKIRDATPRGTFRVPQLKGIVKSHAGVIGILLAYIPHKHRSLDTLLRNEALKRGATPEATPAMRKKWAAQINQTLGQLHDLGILWGDVKTDNVLIDEDNNAFIIDFGGGFTPGLVDPDKFGTMDGDNQGLQHIFKALG